MQSTELREKASKIAQETKNFRETIDRFVPKFEIRWLELLRRIEVEEVEKNFQELMNTGVRETSNRLDSTQEIWIATKCIVVGYEYRLSAVRNKRDRQEAWILAAILRKNQKSIIIPLDDFKTLIQELETSIQEGKMDEKIYMTARQLIYDKTYEIQSKFLPKLDPSPYY